MDLQAIEHTLLFLGRAQLAGNEVPAFVNATNALHELRAKVIAESNAPVLVEKED